MSKIKIDREELIRLYFIQNQSFSQIGEHFGCCSQTILNRFKEFGLKSRTISESMKDRKHTWGDKIGKALKGRKRTIETREKMRQKALGRKAWNKGLRKSKDPKMKNTGMQSENHPMWKGGISNINARIRQSSDYKVWRESIFQRDNYTCQYCNTRSEKGNRIWIEAHHIKSFCEFPELRFEISNGITLCKKCHDKERSKKDGDQKQQF